MLFFFAVGMMLFEDDLSLMIFVVCFLVIMLCDFVCYQRCILHQSGFDPFIITTCGYQIQLQSGFSVNTWK